MDTARYILGVMLIVGLPPAIVFWLLIHPLVGFWRRIRMGVAYSVLAAVCVLLGVFIFDRRDALLGEDLGTSRVLLSVGAVLYALSAWISVLTRRQLDLRAFAGVPELSESGAGSVLLQKGVYGVVRHPRYLSVIIGTAGFAMFVNFVGGYLVVLGSIPALFLVIFFEERELAARFGADYEAYRARVPAMVPRLSRGPRPVDP
ncbi:MAG: methyltransferase family protein [Longimicrobiales bacterium]